MGKLRKKDMWQGTYEVLAFREFENPHCIEPGDFIAAIMDEHTVNGHKTKDRQIIRHIALVKIKNILFGSAYCTVWGDDAESIKQEAIDNGVYAYGDPGKHDRDQRTYINRRPSASGDTWYWCNTERSTLSTDMIWWSSTANQRTA